MKNSATLFTAKAKLISTCTLGL